MTETINVNMFDTILIEPIDCIYDYCIRGEIGITGPGIITEYTLQEAINAADKSFLRHNNPNRKTSHQKTCPNCLASNNKNCRRNGSLPDGKTVRFNRAEYSEDYNKTIILYYDVVDA